MFATLRSTIGRPRTLLVVAFVLAFGVTAVVFAQAATGYVAAYHVSFTDATVTDYATDPGEEAVEIRVDNPSNRAIRVTAVTVNAYEGEQVLTEGGRQVLSEPVEVPPDGARTVTVPLSVQPEHRDRFRQSEAVTVDGRLVVELGDDRQFVDVEHGGGDG